MTYDNVPPTLASASATANPDGTDLDHVAGGHRSRSGIRGLELRRAPRHRRLRPTDAGLGTAICTLTAPATGCMDTNAKSGTFYAYAVFAVDAAGNFTRREASAKAVDTVPPDPVTGLRVVSSDRTYVRLGWTVPALKGNDSDLAGFRVLLAAPGQSRPRSIRATAPSSAATTIRPTRSATRST